MPTKESGKPQQLNIIQEQADNTTVSGRWVWYCGPAKRQFAIKARVSPFVAMAHLLAAVEGTLGHHHYSGVVFEHLPWVRIKLPDVISCSAGFWLLIYWWAGRAQRQSAADWSQTPLDLSNNWVVVKNKYRMGSKSCNCSFLPQRCRKWRNIWSNMKKSKLLSYYTKGTFNFNIWSCCPVNQLHFLHILS